jgi:hypothetical protein
MSAKRSVAMQGMGVMLYYNIIAMFPGKRADICDVRKGRAGWNMLHRCYRKVAVRERGYVTRITRCNKGVTKVLQRCYKGVTKVIIKVLQRCYKGCYKGVTKVLQGCYKGVTKV